MTCQVWFTLGDIPFQAIKIPAANMVGPTFLAAVAELISHFKEGDNDGPAFLIIQKVANESHISALNGVPQAPSVLIILGGFSWLYPRF